jgi:hypothetical protein
VATQIGIVISPIGVILKKHQPNKWRMIHHLSFSEGISINDGNNKEDASISYKSVDSAATRMRAKE